jgi:hypothetical protein
MSLDEMEAAMLDRIAYFEQELGAAAVAPRMGSFCHTEETVSETDHPTIKVI